MDVETLRRITTQLNSDRITDWQAAAEAPGLTERQLAHLARKCESVVTGEAARQKPTPELAESIRRLTRTLLTHVEKLPRIPQILLKSECMEVWLEVAKWPGATDEDLQRIFQLSQQEFNSRYYVDEDMRAYRSAIIQEIWRALTRHPNTSQAVLQVLVRDGETYWPDIIQLPQASTEILSYILNHLERLPLDYQKMLEAFEMRAELDVSLRERVKSFRHYEQLVQRTLDQTLTEAELLEIAQELVRTDLYPGIIKEACVALSWHTRATSRVMTVLARSSQTMAIYIVARSDLADEQALIEVVRKVPLMQKRNLPYYWTMVPTVLANPNATDNVARAVLQEVDDFDVWKNITNAEWASRAVLGEVFVRIDTKCCKGQAIYEDGDPDVIGVLSRLIKHPNGGEELISYMRSVGSREIQPSIQRACIEEYLWQRLIMPQDISDVSPFEVLNWIWGTISSCFSSPVGMKERILEHEWLCSMYLDRLILKVAHNDGGVLSGWSDALKKGGEAGTQAYNALDDILHNQYFSSRARSHLWDLYAVYKRDARGNNAWSSCKHVCETIARIFQWN